jgi:acetyl esterase/lipase
VINIRQSLRLLQAYLIGRRFYVRYEHLDRDIVFNSEMDVRLDVYSPAAGAGYPVLLLVHGGGWSRFKKEWFASAAMKLLPEEMVVVIPDHTLYPHARYEQMTHEVAAAIGWTLENIERYRGDPSRVVVCGHSSGGHLVGLAMLDPRFLRVYGHSAADVLGIIFASTGYDLHAQYDHELAKSNGKGTELMKTMEGVMGGVSNFETASPITYVKADLPPALVLHGDADQTVPVDQAVAFHAALQEAGALSELKIYTGQGHSEILFAALAEKRPQIVADIAAFVHDVKTVKST